MAEGPWTPSFNPRTSSCPFVRTNDSEVFRLRTVTLPLRARTPAVVGLMIATLPEESSVAVTSKGATSMRIGVCAVNPNRPEFIAIWTPLASRLTLTSVFFVEFDLAAGSHQNLGITFLVRADLVAGEQRSLLRDSHAFSQ